MQYVGNTVVAAALAIAGMALAGCQANVSTHGKIEPAQVEHKTGLEHPEVTLTDEAIARIDLQTAVVRETQVVEGEGGFVVRKVVPYSSLIYDPQGEAWVYVSPEPRKFVRHPIEVDRIEGDDAVLLSGPDKDTQVAIVGAAELYGAESGVGH